MMMILVTLWLNGMSITLDAKAMYGVINLKHCNNELSYIIEDFGAERGECTLGDILEQNIKI